MRIANVYVNIEHFKSQGYSSIEELKEEPHQIFAHVEDKDKAYQELWDVIAPKLVTVFSLDDYNEGEEIKVSKNKKRAVK